MSPHVLVADDDPRVLSGLTGICRAAGHVTSEARTGRETLERARSEGPDVVLLDVEMPEGSGLEVLPELVALEDAPSVVMVTGVADVRTAVEAMRSGAADFLEKPVRGGVLEAVLERVLRLRAVVRERDRLRTRVATLMSGPIIGQSRPILRLLEQVQRVAGTPRTTVLVLGESGVGKELVARAIHEHSDRARRPFLAVNCASLSSSLLEAELFGYEAGSFTGASSKGRDGLIAAAEGGTLFLDEIGELELELQARLLRVLQERVYRRVGGNRDHDMDVRVVASTNRNLEQMVEEGRFREDLFYRLNVMTLKVPSLRDRREDVPLLALHFLEIFAKEFGRELEGFSAAAMDRLVAHSWPGNVRELRNTIERAALLASGDKLEPGHLSLGSAPPTSRPEPDPGDQIRLAADDCSIKAMEQALIREVLVRAGGNRSQAARMLGVNRTTLYNKIRLYEIDG